MQSFRRRRYQYVSAGIGRAYYGSLPRRPPRNGRYTPNNVDPAPPWQDLNRTTPVPIESSQKKGKAPWRDLNRASPLPVEGQPSEHKLDQLDVTPQRPGKGSSAHVNTRGKREKSASHRATRASHSTKLSTQDNPAEVPTVTSQALRRTTPSKKLLQDLRGHKFKTINAGIRLEELLPSYDTQEGLEIGSSAATEGAEPSGGRSTSVPSQCTSGGAPAAPLGPAKAAPVVNETDRNLLSQEYLDYGPAFAPYTTKLFNPTEGWEERPALWDISPGCLLWLPPNYKYPKDTRLLHPHPNKLNHPIVVLSVEVSGPEDAVVTFMIIRSFKSLGAKTSTLSFWKKHLPISRFPRESWKDEPEARESWKDALLFREFYPARTISRVQYVDIQSIFTARWEDLHCYQGKRQVFKTPPRLSEKSMAQLRAARTWWEGHYNTDRGLVKWEGEWVPTQQIREVFRRRHIEPRREGDNELGSVVAGKISSEVSERSDELVVKMEGVRTEMRAEFEDARDKMRAELDKVRAETRSELMTAMLAEVEGVREGLQMVNRAEKAVVELKVAKSARPPIPQPEYATSSQLAIWQAATDMPEWSDDLTRKVETMRVELQLVRIEMDVVKAEMEGMRDEVEGMRGDMDKMKVELELVKRANAARETARRQKSSKMPEVGMYAPALGPRSPAARAALPSGAASYDSEGTAEATIRGLKEELEQAMSAPAQAAQPAAPEASSLLQRTRGGPRLGPLAQSRG